MEKEEKPDTKEWIRSFYVLKMIHGTHQATEYMERWDYRVSLAILVSIIGLIAVPLLLVIVLNPDWLGKDRMSYGIYLCMAVIFLLSHFRIKWVKKRWSELNLSTEEMDARTKRALFDISQLDSDEKEILQSLMDAGKSKEAFKKKLEEALQFGKLGKMQLLQDMQDLVGDK